MPLRRFHATSVLLVAGALAVGCSAAPAGPSAGGQGGSTGATLSGGAGAGTTGAAGLGGGAGGLGGSSGGQGGSGGVVPCTGVTAVATAKLQPADIILVIDTSGSMVQESAQVQQNLNQLAAVVSNSGIDVHVVLIAGPTICIPPPLGSGLCNGADEKLPAFRHAVHEVGSHTPLDLILSTYPEWKSSLRADATKTFAVVSDDESDLAAIYFTNDLLALDPPTFAGFKFDAIVSSTDPLSCTDSAVPGTCKNWNPNGADLCPTCANPCCDKSMACAPISMAEGKIYKQLIQQTGGVYGDLCSENFAPVLQDMATGVIGAAQLSCSYDIPPPPDGQTLDPTKVNVLYTPAGAATTPILHVATQADCGASGGWYYDSPGMPSRIVTCPTTCATLKADSSGKVEVLFGCETQLKPPE